MCLLDHIRSHDAGTKKCRLISSPFCIVAISTSVYTINQIRFSCRSQPVLASCEHSLSGIFNRDHYVFFVLWGRAGHAQYIPQHPYLLPPPPPPLLLHLLLGLKPLNLLPFPFASSPP